MPRKSLGLFPASLSTDPLFCLEFVEITNKIETAGDLKARERKGWPWRKTNNYILFCARFAAFHGLGKTVLPINKVAKENLILGQIQ